MSQLLDAILEVVAEHRRRVEDLRRARILTKEAWEKELDSIDDEIDRLLKARRDSEC